MDSLDFEVDELVKIFDLFKTELIVKLTLSMVTHNRVLCHCIAPIVHAAMVFVFIRIPVD